MSILRTPEFHLPGISPGLVVHKRPSKPVSARDDVLRTLYNHPYRNVYTTISYLSYF